MDILLQDGRSATFTPSTPIPPTFLASPWLNAPALATPRNDQPVQRNNDEASASFSRDGLPPSQDPIPERHFEVSPAGDTDEADRHQRATSWLRMSQSQEKSATSQEHESIPPRGTASEEAPINRSRTKGRRNRLRFPRALWAGRVRVMTHSYH